MALGLKSNTRSHSKSTTSSDLAQWRPYYLRRSVLALFIASCTVIIIAVESLVAFSNQHQGLVTTHSRLHYLWTYGPTATLTLVGAFWARAEYQAKLAAPWERMSNTGVTISDGQSILLDYLDMWLPKLLFKAYKNRDWKIVETGAVRLLFIVATILSTSLFTLVSISITEETFIKVETRFLDEPKSASWWSSGFDDGILPRTLLKVAGFIHNGLPYPSGTTEKFAHQRFNQNQSPFLDGEVRASIDGISIDLDCQKADLVWFNSKDGSQGEKIMNISIYSKECNPPTTLYRLSDMFSVPKPLENSSIVFSNYLMTDCGNRQDWETRLAVVIFELSNYTTSQQPVLKRSTQLVCKLSPRLQVLDMVTQPNGTKILTVSERSQHRELNKEIAASISYAMSDNSAWDPDQKKSLLQYLSVHAPEHCSSELDIRMILGLLLHSPSPVPPLSSLFDENLLEGLTKRFVQTFLVQVVNNEFTVAASEQKPARKTRIIDRLRMRSDMSHWIVGILAVSNSLILILILTSPRRGIGPFAPNTITKIAATLSMKGELLEDMSGLGAACLASLERALKEVDQSPGDSSSPARLGARLGEEDLLDVPEDQQDASHGHCGPESQCKLKLPLALRPALRAAMMLVGPLLIGLLELSARRSQDKHGLVRSIETNSGYRLLWSFGPSTVSRLLAAYYTTLDWSLRSREPVYRMCSTGGSFSWSTVNLDILDRSLPGILLTELKSASWSPLASTLASLLGSLLTILSASLFMSRSTEGYASMSSLSFFEGSFKAQIPLQGNLSNVGYTSTMLILDRNMPYPAFTYGDLVLPELTVGNNVPEMKNILKVNSNLPALRSRLTCELHDPASIKLYYSMLASPDNKSLAWTIFADITPENTGLTLKGESAPHLQLWNPGNVSKPSGGARTHCVARFKDRSYLPLSPSASYTVGLGGSARQRREAHDNMYTLSDYEDHDVMDCASDFVYLWGRIDRPAAAEQVQGRSADSLFAYACNETIEVVEVNVELSGNEFRIDPNQPPSVINTAALTSNDTTIMPPSIPAVDGRNTDLYRNHLFDTILVDDRSANVNEFLQLLLLPGSEPSISKPDLQNSSISAAQRVADAINRQHRILRAQIISADFRVGTYDKQRYNAASFNLDEKEKENFTSTFGDNSTFRFYRNNGSQVTIAGNVTYTPDGTRLIQDESSTRSLQAVLGAIILLSAMSWLTQLASMDPDVKNLPFHDRSPTCIASIMALLADSNIFDFLPPNRELPPPNKSRKFGCIKLASDEDKRFEESFKGFKFRLGWRVIKDSTSENGWRRVFTLIVVPKEEEKDLESASDSGRESRASSNTVSVESYQEGEERV